MMANPTTPNTAAASPTAAPANGDTAARGNTHTHTRADGSTVPCNEDHAAANRSTAAGLAQTDTPSPEAPTAEKAPEAKKSGGILSMLNPMNWFSGIWKFITSFFSSNKKAEEPQTDAQGHTSLTA